jgi:hypothetical protein
LPPRSSFFFSFLVEAWEERRDAWDFWWTECVCVGFRVREKHYPAARLTVWPPEEAETSGSHLWSPSRMSVVEGPSLAGFALWIYSTTSRSLTQACSLSTPCSTLWTTIDVIDLYEFLSQ